MGTLLLRSLLTWTVVALALAGGPASLQAGNGEPVAGEGLYRPPTCDFDFTIDCDDRFDANVVSCHMRGPQGDEGYAKKACIDGRIAVGAAVGDVLEEDVTIKATDFGVVSCGEELDDLGNPVSFCIVCDTLKGTTTSTGKKPAVGPGATACVKIVNNGQTNAPGTCGAFNVTNDAGGACLGETQELQQTFSDPELGFIVNMNASDAGQPGAKDLLLCERSWQCIDDPLPLSIDAKVQGSQGDALINTGCCMRLASGAYYCSSTLKTSSTCR
jgi:hypothetical protein